LIETDRERRRAEDLNDPAALGRTERLEQLHDVADALRGLHAARLRQRFAALVHVDREAHELRDDEASEEDEHQPAEERARSEAHQAASTFAAST
jgi:Ran GTPase-activating protein (RanGAP) involved in mRNA processing and transport